MQQRILHCRSSDIRRIIAIALTTALTVLVCSCTTLSTAEGMETRSVSLSGRIFDIHFDDSAPITVRLDQTGLPDARKSYRIRSECVQRSNISGDMVYAETFTQNRWNIVQEIREMAVPPGELKDYSILQRRCAGYMLKRMGFSSIADFYEDLQVQPEQNGKKKIIPSLDRAAIRGKYFTII